MVDANSTTVETVERMEEDEDLSCWLNFSPVYSITSSCISFMLPCVVMVGIYVKLWSIGRGHVKNIRVRIFHLKMNIFNLIKKQEREKTFILLLLSFILHIVSISLTKVFFEENYFLISMRAQYTVLIKRDKPNHSNYKISRYLK